MGELPNWDNFHHNNLMDFSTNLPSNWVDWNTESYRSSQMHRTSQHPQQRSMPSKQPQQPAPQALPQSAHHQQQQPMGTTLVMKVLLQHSPPPLASLCSMMQALSCISLATAQEAVTPQELRVGRATRPHSCSGGTLKQVGLLLHMHAWEPWFPPNLPGSSCGPYYPATLPQQQQ